MYIIYLAAFTGAVALRHSPQTPDSIIASIRSGVVLPANRLSRGPAELCDSLVDGPFCGLLTGGGSPSVEGILDKSLWGGIPDPIYQSKYTQLSEYAQHHWSGSALATPKPVRTSSLSKREDALFVFQPHGVVVETAHFAPSPSSSALYILNSFFGYISFVHSSVSVIEFNLRAPTSSSVLVRAFQEGHMIWARIVPAGESLDVASASPSVDPSLESVSYIEIIGTGAEILSLRLSLPSTNNSATYMFMDADLANPSKYSGVRLFEASAHLMDMESAIREGYRIVPAGTVTDAISHSVLSFESFSQRLEDEPLLYGPQFVDHFFATIESYLHNGARNDRSFDVIFSSVLLESAAEVVAFALAEMTPSGNVPPAVAEESFGSGQEKARQLKGLRARFEKPDHVDPALLETVVANLGDLGRVSFTQPPEPLAETASRVVVALYAHLGEQRFTEIIIRSRLLRLAKSEPVATDGIDERTLTEMIVEGLDLPITQETPVSYKKELLKRVIAILTNGDETGSALLADMLVL